MDYQEAAAKLGNRDCKKVGNNTHLIRRDGESIGLRLHNTFVLTFYANGEVELNTGGWQTVTTKARINEYAPHGWGVHQNKHVWYISRYLGDGKHSPAIEFENHMRISADGATVQA